MMNNFSTWMKWRDRSELDDLDNPGVYSIAISNDNISNTPFSWRQEIIYVGMTNSKGGLKSRLQQFDNTIRGKVGHGGAHRVRFKYPNYDNLTRRLFVSVSPTKCTVTSKTPANLRLMGKVAAQEYECFAKFVEAFGRLPEFNDMARSPKK